MFRREQINTTMTIDINGITIPAATMPLRSTKDTCITILFKYPSCLAWFYLLCTHIELKKTQILTIKTVVNIASTCQKEALDCLYANS